MTPEERSTLEDILPVKCGFDGKGEPLTFRPDRKVVDGIVAFVDQLVAAEREACAAEAETQRRDVPDAPGGPPQVREEATMQAIAAAIRSRMS